MATARYTYYHYDELNRRVQVVHKSGTITDTINPDGRGHHPHLRRGEQRGRVTDPNNNSTTNTYDALNRPSSSTNAAGDLSRTFYDPVGNVIETIDPRGNVTTYAYDADNRLIRRSDSVGLVAGASVRCRRQCALDHQWQWECHDHDLRRPQSSHSHDRPAWAHFDNVVRCGGQPGEHDRPRRQHHDLCYDGINRMIKTVDALGDTTTNAYDAAGNKSPPLTRWTTPPDTPTTRTTGASRKPIPTPCQTAGVTATTRPAISFPGWTRTGRPRATSTTISTT